MENEIPHEKSYRCRELELRVKQLDLELIQTQGWVQDDKTRWDLKLIGKYLLIPLIRINKPLASLNYKIASFNDKSDRKFYLEDISKE
jgi:hypothetical protein